MPDLSPPRHEPADIGLRFALTVAAVLVMLLVLVAGTTPLLFPGALRNPPLRLPEPPRPSLQSSPRTDMAALRADQLARLNSAGRTAEGGIHIPIDLAMRKLAEQGIPGWPAP